jgi:O-antigen/teichoic acid export membrane protein
LTRFTNKLKDLSIVGITDISSAGISALFWFYVASGLGPETYGKITYFLSIAGLASTISLLGAANTLTVYTAKKVPLQTAIYVLTLSASTISSIVVFLIFFDVGTSFLILGYTVFGLVIAEILGRKIYKTYAKFILTQKALMVSLTIGLYYLIGESGILIGIAASFSPYVVNIIQGFKKYPINFLLVKERAEFLVNSYLQTLTGVFSGSLDKIIIAPFFGFALLGNYSLGLQFLTLLSLLPTAVGKYLIPENASGFENKKLKKYIILFSIGLAILGFTVGPLVISSIFPKFIQAEEIIRIVSISVIPNTIVMIYYAKFLGREKSRLVLISSIIWICVQISGIIILGSIYGVNGIATAYVLASTASAIHYVLTEKLLIRRNSGFRI